MLNESQQKVVEEASGYSLVLAGAGTGKTLTLASRLAYLLESGVDERNIILLTFTNKAAREMLSRIYSLVGETKDLLGGTFHHTANYCLRRCDLSSFGLNSSFSIIDQQDSYRLFSKAAKEKRIELPKNILPAEAFYLLELSRHRLAPEEKIKDIYEEVIHRYTQIKRNNNSVDFSDLLELFLKILRSPQGERLKKRAHYILVDEYQDTNRLQHILLKELASIHHNLLVVGDSCQSIYAFRGASLENIINFPKDYPGCKVFNLLDNYRSSQEILDIANKVISFNKFQNGKQLVAIKGYTKEFPVLFYSANRSEEASTLVNLIKEFNQFRPLKELAVLTRCHFQLATFEVELRKNNIPYQVRGGLKFFEQAHIKDALALLQIKMNPSDALSWERFLTSFPGIGRKKSESIIKKVLSHKKPLLEISSSDFLWHNKILTCCAQVLDIIEKFLQDESPTATIKRISSLWLFNLIKEKYDNPEERIEDVKALIRIAEDYSSTAQFLSTVLLEESSFRQPNTTDFLTLSTVHQAKGLEWNVVFVIGLVNGEFPYKKSFSNPKAFEEERRLFYVAITRAKEKVFLSVPTNSNRFYSTFIQEVPESLCQEVEYEKLNGRQNVERNFSP